MKWILIAIAALVALAAAAYGGLVWMITRPLPPLELGPTISLAQGEIQAGIDRDNPEILQFNGLPFAAAPVGERRWREPMPPTGWDVVRDASQFGAECMQSRDGSGEFLSDLLNGLGLNPVQRHLDRKSVV